MLMIPRGLVVSVYEISLVKLCATILWAVGKNV